MFIRGTVGSGLTWKTSYIRSFNILNFCFYKVYHIFSPFLRLGVCQGLKSN